MNETTTQLFQWGFTDGSVTAFYAPLLEVMKHFYPHLELCPQFLTSKFILLIFVSSLTTAFRIERPLTFLTFYRTRVCRHVWCVCVWSAGAMSLLYKRYRWLLLSEITPVSAVKVSVFKKCVIPLDSSVHPDCVKASRSLLTNTET